MHTCIRPRGELWAYVCAAAPGRGGVLAPGTLARISPNSRMICVNRSGTSFKLEGIDVDSGRRAGALAPRTETDSTF